MTPVPFGALRASDTFTHRGRRYMVAREGGVTFSADGAVTRPVLPLQGVSRKERMLTAVEVGEAAQGSYRPWADGGNRHEGEPITADPEVAA